MSYCFLIKSGPLKGTRYPISANMTLGRSTKADLPIQDSKVSSIHAQIQKKGKDFYLIDKGSKNKIRLDGAKHDSILLTDNTLFQLGNTQIQVEKTKPEAEHWHQVLYKILSEKKFENSSPSNNIKPLSPSITLTFLTGLQRKTKWTLGYGPRNIGSTSYDLPVIGDNIPEVCFSILPTNQGNLFQTQHPDIVLLNNQSIKKSTVKHKDIIYIGNTKIQIHLV